MIIKVIRSYEKKYKITDRMVKFRRIVGMFAVLALVPHLDTFREFDFGETGGVAVWTIIIFMLLR